MEAKRDMMKKVPVREQDPKVRATNFKEVCLGYNMEEAVAESERCLNCKNAKCIAGCPVSIDIPAFIQEVKAGNIEEAAKSSHFLRHFRQSVDVSAHRRISARVSVSVVSRVSLYPSDVWSVSWQITTWHTERRQS